MTTGLLRRHLLLTTGIALLLGACSAASAPTATPASNGAAPAGDTASAGAATIQPAVSTGAAEGACAIVTKEAVGQAAGFAIATASGAGGVCIFQNADPSKYLSVWVFGDQATMAPMLEIENTGEHIAGLGDDAFWIGAGGILFVRKGDHGVEFSDPDFIFTPDTNTAPRDAMVTLARTALPNL